MYYRKIKDNYKLTKLTNESTIYCKGSYFHPRKNRHIRLNSTNFVKIHKKQSNKRIRRYKFKSYKGNWYKRVYDVKWLSY